MSNPSTLIDNDAKQIKRNVLSKKNSWVKFYYRVK